MTRPTIEQHIKAWLAVIVIGGLILGYLRFLDGTIIKPVMDFGTGTYQFQTASNEYSAGDQVQVQSREFCKKRNVTATTSYVLENHLLLPYIEKQTNIPTGCYEGDKVIDLIQLPEFISIGTFSIRGTTCYEVNPIREICYPFTTNQFEIVKDKLLDQ